MDCLYIVVPCYNEEEVIRETTKRLTEKLCDLINNNIILNTSKIMYVDDGSKDNTYSIIKELNQENQYVSGVKLAHNRGHQNALVAGLETAKNYADIIISMDCDLQDDINAIDEMIKKYKSGCDIVYGVRNSRKKDTAFKRNTAQAFYKLINFMGAEVVYNHADYRLMSKRAVEGLCEYKEVNLFLRGIVPMIGYKTDIVYYERGERFAGESKYPLKKMINFAFDGITSLSIKPIRLILLLGTIIFAVSIIMLIYFLAIYFMGKTVQGWTSIAISVWAIGGLQLLAIGVIGEYLGKIYLETKKRPRYIIEEILI